MSLQSGVTQRDLNVKEAWAQGYTGRGIVVSILDDGIEKNHPDLAGNYVRRWRREAAVPGERHLAGGVGGWEGGARECCVPSRSTRVVRLTLMVAMSFPGSWGQLRCQRPGPGPPASVHTDE